MSILTVVYVRTEQGVSSNALPSISEIGIRDHTHSILVTISVHVQIVLEVLLEQTKLVAFKLKLDSLGKLHKFLVMRCYKYRLPIYIYPWVKLTLHYWNNFSQLTYPWYFHINSHYLFSISFTVITFTGVFIPTPSHHLMPHETEHR